MRREDEGAFSSRNERIPLIRSVRGKWTVRLWTKLCLLPRHPLCPFLSLDLLLLPFSPRSCVVSVPLPGKPGFIHTGGTLSSFFSPSNFHSWIKSSSSSLSFTISLLGRESRDGLAERRQNVRQILLDGVINWEKRVKRLIRRWEGGVRWIGDDKYLGRECFGCVLRLT